MPINIVDVQIGDDPNKNFPLSNYFVDFDQPFDHITGSTNGQPALTQCRITILTSLDNSLDDFFAWEISPDKQEDLSIKFLDTGNLVKTYTFTKAYLVSLEHAIQQQAGQGWRQAITLHLSPESCTIENKTYKRPKRA